MECMQRVQSMTDTNRAYSWARWTDMERGGARARQAVREMWGEEAKKTSQSINKFGPFSTDDMRKEGHSECNVQCNNAAQHEQDHPP